jgi:hypothetical protein
VRFYEIPEEAGSKRYRAEIVGDILAIDLKQQLEDDGASSDAGKPQRAAAVEVTRTDLPQWRAA